MCTRSRYLYGVESAIRQASEPGAKVSHAPDSVAVPTAGVIDVDG
jgi:hypothetical protein